MKQAMPRFWEFDSRAWIGSITVPTLVIAGGADPVVPVAHARAVHEAISGSRFLTVDDGGHVPSTVLPESVVSAFQSFASRLTTS